MNENQTAYIFTGDAKSGKSKLLSLIDKMKISQNSIFDEFDLDDKWQEKRLAAALVFAENDIVIVAKEEQADKLAEIISSYEGLNVTICRFEKR